MSNEVILLKEDTALASRIATLHFEYYADKDQLAVKLHEHRDAIQCVVGAIEISDWNLVPFGEAQRPGLMDY